MTEDELKAKIDELTEAANGLEEFDKLFQLNEINILKNKLEGGALRMIRQKLEQIQLPDLHEIDTQIAMAKDATKSNEARVDAFKIGFRLLRTAVGIPI